MSVVIIGAGGHGKVAFAALSATGVAVSAFFDDDGNCHGSTVCGAPVLGPVIQAAGQGLPIHVAIGSNAARRSVVDRLGPVDYAAAIHPRADVDGAASLGRGVLVGAMAMVQIDARIGDHVIVNTGVIVEHDCRIGDFCHLAPGSVLAGGVHLGNGVLVGLGAVVLPGVRIGDDAVIGAGAVVHRDVAAGDIVVGVPAASLKRSS